MFLKLKNRLIIGLTNQVSILFLLIAKVSPDVLVQLLLSLFLLGIVQLITNTK